VLHWSLVRLAHCLLVIALNDVYYFEQIKYDDEPTNNFRINTSVSGHDRKLWKKICSAPATYRTNGDVLHCQ